MKKRVIGLLLSLVLSIGLIGCGKSAEQEQETNSEGEQEETQEDSIEYDEFEYFYASEVYDSDKVISCNLDNLSNNEIYCGDWTLTNSIDLYSRREGGVVKVGYTKENIPVNVYAADSEWIQLLFENEEQPYTFMFIKVEDFLANSDYDESKANYVITEEPVAETTDPYEEILSKVGYDKNKEYTIDEYSEVLTNIFKELGKEYNLELAGMSPFDSYDGFHIETSFGITEYTEETTKSLINYIEYGRDGWGGITEFCVVKAQNNEGEEGLNIFVKVDNEVIEKNKSEWQ